MASLLFVALLYMIRALYQFPTFSRPIAWTGGLSTAHFGNKFESKSEYLMS